MEPWEGQKKSNFTFYKNTPFVDLENTVNFTDNESRDRWFLNHYDKTAISTTLAFNYVRDRGELKVNIDYQKTYGINYCHWETEGDPIRHYAFVTDIVYLNDMTVRFMLVEDGIMTYLQGDFPKTLDLKNVMVHRQHLSKDNYNKYLEIIRTNDDVLQTNTQKYTDTLFYDFAPLVVVFQSSVDLEKNFGTADDPKMSASRGLVYDHIASPVNLYYCTYDDWQTFTSRMSPYPWIAQNFQKILLVPKLIIDDDDLETIENKTTGLDISMIKRFKNNHASKNMNLTIFNRNTETLCNMFGISEGVDWHYQLHLLRSQYCNIEMTSYTGQQLPIEPEFLDVDEGLAFYEKNVVGFNNEIKIYPKNYKSRDDKGWTTEHTTFKGASLDYALNFNQFDDVPIMIDNYKLSLAQSAHERELAQDKLLTSRLGNIVSPPKSASDLGGKIMDAISLASNANPTQLLSGITEEYEYYRTQKAQFADRKITSPTVTSSTSSNNFSISQSIFGVFVKFSSILPEEMKQIRRYHALYGYQFNKNMEVDSIDTMQTCNYLRFSGNWFIPNCDTKIFAVIKAQLENGVKFWRPTDDGQPFKNELLDIQNPIK